MLDLEQKALSLIDARKDELIALVSDLIKYRSVSGNETGIQGFLEMRLKNLGFETDLWEPDLAVLEGHPLFSKVSYDYNCRPNLVAIYRGTGGGRSLLFNGHVDVIPAADTWNVSPWNGEVRDNRIFGRGASDMKSGVAAATFAAEILASLGVKTKGDLILEYVVDEENTAHGTLACVLRGYRADAGISCEASDLEVQPAATGSMWFRIQVSGKSSSMSRRWEGVSALEKAWRIHQAVQDFEQIRIAELSHSLYPDPRGALACFVGTMNGGEFPSSTPAGCVLTGRMATIPGEDPAQSQASFIDFIMNASSQDAWLKHHPPQVTFYGINCAPVEISPNHPICASLEDAFLDVTGRLPVVKGHEGGADTRVLIPYGKTPTVIFGPGLISQMHADNEWVPVENVVMACKVYALTMLRWLGY